MDVFNQNWTQRMKADPFVNQTLNNLSTRPIRIGIDVERHYWDNKTKQWKKQEMQYPYNQQSIRLIKRWKQIPDDHPMDKPPPQRLRKSDNFFTRKPAIVRSSKTHSEEYKDDRLYPNSRPNSLYNLHYASLR